MSLKFKIDVLEALKEHGYSTYKIRQEKLIGQRVIQQLRDRSPVSWAVIAKLCELLQCQPGDILEYVPDASVNSDPDKPE